MDDGSWWQAEAALFHAVHDTTHHFMDVGEGLVRVGAAAPAAEGTIVAVHLSHGRPRPFEAVWIGSREAVTPGSDSPPNDSGACSEGMLLSGIDLDVARPGTRLAAGKAVLELSYPAGSGWHAWIRRAGDIRAGDTASLSPE